MWMVVGVTTTRFSSDDQARCLKDDLLPRMRGISPQSTSCFKQRMVLAGTGCNYLMSSHPGKCQELWFLSDKIDELTNTTITITSTNNTLYCVLPHLPLKIVW